MALEVSESALTEFFSECGDILQRFSSSLSKAEKVQIYDEEVIDSLYRDMHTLKGSAQLFGFRYVACIAHAIEASLDPIRRLRIQIPPQLIDVVFKTIDLIDRILNEIMKFGNEKEEVFRAEVEGMVPLLIGLVSGHFGGEINFEKTNLPIFEDTPELVNNLSLLSKDLTRLDIGHNKGHGVKISNKEQGALQVAQHMESQAAKETTESNDPTSTIRIQVGLLDKLMNLVGEMVLVRNQMLQYTQKHDSLEFLNLSQRLDLVTSELQGEVMKTRMQPIGTVLSKFQRVIRDLARDLGKQIEMIVQGSETELDKTLLEAIKDPLTHIIRNSCDHGLEKPEERIQAGKDTVGRVMIKAFHEGGLVIIEISDDGRGLNIKRILDKALDKKIVSQEHAAKMSEHEISQLIFAPGFSTAEQVTAVSGRGVGMDVVKTNLEKIGGQVELHSKPQKGMTIRLKIPLTLAIVPALIVRAGKNQFAIPQVKLAELVRVEKEGNGPKIEVLQGKPVFRLRGHLLPLVSLSEVFQFDSRPGEGFQSDCINIVVLNGEAETFGLIVDEIKDTADIVVKPLPSFLKKLAVYSGATIMGDGSVSLILDITGIAHRGNLIAKGKRVEEGLKTTVVSAESKINLDSQDFLFFKLNSNETYCMPLCLVNRLEEVVSTEVERSGSQKILKYRGSILPIVSLNEFLGLTKSTPTQVGVVTSLIVVQKKSRLYGIEVDQIQDIMSVQGAIEDSLKEVKGILGSIIVEQKVATVVDILGILDAFIGPEEKAGMQKASESSTRSIQKKKNHQHILFAEDTVFFMKQVKKILEKNGYKVSHAADGEAAWQMLNSAKEGEYQLLLSDIEMPRLNGFDLASRVRADARFTKMPLIALTTKYRDVDRERGEESGFTRYLEKLRSDELIETLKEILGGVQ